MPQKKDVKFLIIHHTATSRDRTKFLSLKNSYNWVITADGILHESRPQNITGGHCRADRMNYKSLGICLTGNFQTEHPTEKQLATLRGIIDQLKKIYNIPTENILGHKEVKGAQTACPGTNLMTFIKTIRKINGYNEGEVSELRQENGLLKSKNTKLNIKLMNAKNVIKELKVAIQAKKNWAETLIELIKRNE